MIGVCTDSNAQVPADLAARLGIEVVALTVTVNGQEYLEGVDLDADGFYRFFEEATPTVSTAAPGPGRFADAYRLLAQHGATEIVSVHIGSTVSGTLNAAHLAARDTDVPVHLVDTGAASFVVGAAAIEAAGAAAQGAAAAEVMAIAERTAGACGNVFIVGGLDFMRAGGRLDASLAGEPLTVPVLSLVDGTVSQIGSAANPDEATALMVDAVRDSGAGAGARIKATVGTSDVWSFDIGDQLDKRLSATDGVDVARYRIGPSVGAHTGPGSVGVVFYPSESRQVAVLS